MQIYVSREEVAELVQHHPSIFNNVRVAIADLEDMEGKCRANFSITEDKCWEVFADGLKRAIDVLSGDDIPTTKNAGMLKETSK